MVKISIDGDQLRVEVQGLHKLWSLKSTLEIPLTDIDSVRHDPDRARSAFPGLRIPGTHIPTVYTAGTYYQSDLQADFWVVRNPDNAIVIQCREGSAFDEIIVEVEDPAAVVALIEQGCRARDQASGAVS